MCAPNCGMCCDHLQTELQKKHKEISQNVAAVETAIGKLQHNSDLIKVTLGASTDMEF